MNSPDCTCVIRNPGHPRAEYRVLSRDCPRHGDQRAAFSAGYAAARAELAKSPDPDAFGSFAWSLVRSEDRDLRHSVCDGIMAAVEDAS